LVGRGACSFTLCMPKDAMNWPTWQGLKSNPVLPVSSPAHKPPDQRASQNRRTEPLKGLNFLKAMQARMYSCGPSWDLTIMENTLYILIAYIILVNVDVTLSSQVPRTLRESNSPISRINDFKLQIYNFYVLIQTENPMQNSIKWTRHGRFFGQILRHI
jgi:hypothetical protein